MEDVSGVDVRYIFKIQEPLRPERSRMEHDKIIGGSDKAKPLSFVPKRSTLPGPVC